MNNEEELNEMLQDLISKSKDEQSLPSNTVLFLQASAVISDLKDFGCDVGIVISLIGLLLQSEGDLEQSERGLDNHRRLLQVSNNLLTLVRSCEEFLRDVQL